MSFVTGVRGRAGGKPANNQQRGRYYMTDEQALQSIIERERRRGGVSVSTPGHEPGCPCNECYALRNNNETPPEPLPCVMADDDLWGLPDDAGDDKSGDDDDLWGLPDDAGDGLTPLPVVG